MRLIYEKGLGSSNVYRDRVVLNGSSMRDLGRNPRGGGG